MRPNTSKLVSPSITANKCLTEPAHRSAYALGRPTITFATFDFHQLLQHHPHTAIHSWLHVTGKLHTPSKHDTLLDVRVHVVLKHKGTRSVVGCQRQLDARSGGHSKDRSPDHVQGQGQRAQGKGSSGCCIGSSRACKGRGKR
eukprot:1139851-Pelagomonas_calceolata.AAC.4